MKTMKLLFVITTMLAACSGDSVQKDLLNYVNTEMPKLATLENEAIGAYDGVAGENYQNDSIMYFTIKQTVIPKYEEFSAKLSAIQPATPEVTSMNEEYKKAAQDQLEGFKLVCLAIEKQDPEIIKQANNDIEKARNLLDLWKKDLDDQCKKHGVVLGGADDKK